MDVPRRNARAFVYRAGVRIAGTVVACDASAGSDLAFLSHAAVLGARGRRALPRVGGGRRQILSTDTTLALLGPVGDRLRAQALVTAYGRPFALGDMRLEIFSSGYMPGAASLLCERGGRRTVYSGPIGAEAEVRAADALCVDARFAAPGAVLPERATAEANLRQAVRETLAAGGAPVLLIEPPILALSVGLALDGDGIPLRAHRAIMDAAAIYRRAKLPAPALQRFAGRLAPDEVLLWPAGAPALPHVVGARPPKLIRVSPRADGPAALARTEVSRALAFPFGADFAGLLRYVEQTGASEVALVGAPDDALVEVLGARGLDAYRLGPPRQIDLFAGA
jgi:putative mRNA 3-end processing factor